MSAYLRGHGQSAFLRVQRARKPRRCDACGGTIDAGQTYVRSALAPGREPYDDSTRWHTINTHGPLTTDCPT